MKPTAYIAMAAVIGTLLSITAIRLFERNGAGNAARAACSAVILDAQMGSTKIAVEKALSTLAMEGHGIALVVSERGAAYFSNLASNQTRGQAHALLVNETCDIPGRPELSFQFYHLPWQHLSRGSFFLFIFFLITTSAAATLFRITVSKTQGLILTKINRTIEEQFGLGGNSDYHPNWVAWLFPENKSVLTKIKTILLDLEKTVAQQRTEIRSATEGAIRREEELKRKEETRRIARQIGHDLRSPLSSLQSLLDTPLEQGARHSLILGIERMNEMLNELQELELNTHDVPRTRHRDVGEVLITQALEEIRPYAKSIGKKISFIYDFDRTRLSSVLVHSSDFRRVLANILRNSIEAIDKFGAVFVRSEIIENNLHISIKDNGPGISASILDNIFEDGFSHGKPNGSGLGLSFAKSIIEGYDGKICIYSHSDAGTEVKIQIPMESSPCVYRAMIPPSHAPAVLVDDDESVYATLTKSYPSKPIKYFPNASEFRRWARMPGLVAPDTYFLFDFHLGNNENGLDLINAVASKDHCFILTSDYLNQTLQDTCRALNVPIIPKNLLAV